jgi:hypothetical protein
MFKLVMHRLEKLEIQPIFLNNPHLKGFKNVPAPAPAHKLFGDYLNGDRRFCLESDG